MLANIPIKFLENDFFEIKGSPITTPQIMYMDFVTNTTTVNTNNSVLSATSMNTISPNVMTKYLQLNSKVSISVSPYHNIEPQELLYNIINKLHEDFFKKLETLGEKHRQEDTTFDIDIGKMKREKKPMKNIIYKMNAINNLIYTKSRIGPAKYFTSNSKTYDYIYSYIKDEELIYNNGQLYFGNTPFIINENVSDDIILAGTKNKMDQSGLHCVIQTDGDDNILLHKINGMTNTEYVVFYEIFDIGTNPHHQFFKSNTKSISYYRMKKLEKINNSKL